MRCKSQQLAPVQFGNVFQGKGVHSLCMQQRPHVVTFTLPIAFSFLFPLLKTFKTNPHNHIILSLHA